MTDENFSEAATAVYDALLTRLSEANPQPRLAATRRAVELLGDPHRAYPIIHITGTNGKTSTSRIIDSLLRAYGLKTGLLTSPHLERFNERIVIDGEPIDDESLARNWDDILPYLEITDAELVAAGELPLTFFEALTVLAFACFADAPVDAVVLEVGMGGEWDSTNVADGQVSVFTPIALDHVGRIGDTIVEIAKTKSGIIKPSSSVVSAKQLPEVMAELERAASLTESSFTAEGAGFELTEARVAVGGQQISVRGRAGSYDQLFLPLYGAHQAQNAAVAIAAVEQFIGAGETPLNGDLLAEGLATVTSPGRLHLVGIEPSILVDAAHNPHGAASLVTAVKDAFDFDEIAVVVGILSDKDAPGIIEQLAKVATRFVVTQSASERAIPAEALAEALRGWMPDGDIAALPNVADALGEARDWAADGGRRAVLITGSITLVGEAMAIAAENEWMTS